MDFNVLRFGFLGDEDIGEDDSNDEDNNNDNHTFPQPSFRLPQPCDTAVFPFLGTRGSTSVMMMRHGLFQDVVE